MSKVKELNEHLSLLTHKMDSLLHLMKDMVLLEGKIESMEEEIRGRLERMEAAQVDSSKLVDRLIEMSMVTCGQPQEATVHRAQSRLEHANFSDPQSWAEGEVDEDVWPPPGCDTMDVNG